MINVVCHYDDDNYRHESWIAECSRDEVLERYAGWHESLLRLFAAAATWYKWALYDRDPIPQWTRGRVTVLGDPEGRGAAWLADYDASSPDVLAA